MERSGVTLTDAIVSIAVLGVLVALLLPALQSSREAARASDCRLRMRQCALAVHNFHETHRVLPGPLTLRANRPAFPKMLSAWGHLLPHLDQTNLFAMIDGDPTEVGARAYPGPPMFQRPSNNALLQTALPVVMCPSDTTPTGGCNFRICWGSAPSVEFRNPEIDKALAGVWYQEAARGPVRLDMVTDGLSQTVLLSERIAGDQDPKTYSPSRDTYAFQETDAQPAPETPAEYAMACATRFTQPLTGEMSYGGATWLISGKAYTVYNHVLGPNSRTPDCSSSGPTLYRSATTARSWHPGGVNCAFADGSVRLQSESIDIYLWRELASRSGGEVAVP